MRRFKPFRLFALMVAAFGVADTAAQAQDYPVKPVKWVVAYPPGGTTDILARIIGQYLSEHLGQQFADRPPARRRQQHRHRGGGELAARRPVRLLLADPAIQHQR